MKGLHYHVNNLKTTELFTQYGSVFWYRNDLNQAIFFLSSSSYSWGEVGCGEEWRIKNGSMATIPGA